MPLKDPIAAAAWHKQYYKDNRDRLLKEVKQYNKDHSEEKKAYDKQYHKDHSEEIKAYRKQYHKDHRDKINERQKQYDKDHREEIKQYKKDHPEVGLKAQKKLFKKLGCTPYQIMAWSWVIRKGKNCSYCDSDKNLHAHHLLSKSRYPDLKLNENNGIPLCVTCHREHHSLNGATA